MLTYHWVAHYHISISFTALGHDSSPHDKRGWCSCWITSRIRGTVNCWVFSYRESLYFKLSLRRACLTMWAVLAVGLFHCPHVFLISAARLIARWSFRIIITLKPFHKWLNVQLQALLLENQLHSGLSDLRKFLTTIPSHRVAPYRIPVVFTLLRHDLSPMMIGDCQSASKPPKLIKKSVISSNLGTRINLIPHVLFWDHNWLSDLPS